ncbi:hypothetical protein KsCSTR_48770 [Candidatus Kuenenia stuttgartiensis]|uniref:Uncharacterized protein n=1 Tax=Kuenenia stuttgartiensis TaxID=174633 RepID=Q1PVL0_KUEST|nr:MULTISPECIES: hypothetical protein [Kuenenia]MCZ7621633.1 hypothetical protein [Candidatus Kuenenia sp.]QII14254.1 hypothetical protein KsCSTR_48770 [Candidatus Kuenenia stuttgartiensis]CAJ71267.1 unknown protein [Candidatus Kuenenia stuttgartiensis]
MNTDKHGFGFEKLVVLFAQTQSELQKQAARSVDIALVVRNWLFSAQAIENQRHFYHTLETIPFFLP